jgi:uncharacterized cupredoxin-like copper-binding protein
MNLKFLFIVSLAILLFIPVALSADYNVSVDITPKTFDTKPCGIATYDITVTNTGNLEDTYSFSIAGIPDGWYTLSQDSTTIESGKSQKIYLFITPDCYEGKYGLFNGTFVVTDQSGNSVSFTLYVIPDHILEVTMPDTLKVCLGEATETTVTVSNKGNYTEDVSLTATGDAADFVTFSEGTFTLGPYEQKEITATITAQNVDYGNYSLTVEATSSTSYALSSASSVVQVAKCYDVDVTYPAEVTACAGESKTFEMTVKNIGVKNDTYEISIEDLNYSTTVSLAPGESKTLDIGFLEATEGTYEISFTVSSNFVTKDGTITFTIEKCYGVELTLEENNITIESGKGKLVKGNVKNTGTISDTFDVISDAIWSVIRPNKVTLDSNQTQDIYAYFSPEYGMTGVQTVSITAKSVKSQDTKELTIDILPREGVTTTTIEETTTIPEETTVPVTTTVVTNETTTTGNVTTTAPQIPTGSIIDIIYSNRAIRSLLIAIIVVIIILIIIYLVVMR